MGESRTGCLEAIGRNILAFSIVVGAIVGITILAVSIINNSAADERSETANALLVALLPLFGTWVGTVLAYYFSKENFESAADRSLALFTATTTREKLESTPVRTWMRGIGNMRYEKWTEAWAKDKLISDIIDEMQTENKERLPILTEDKQPLYIIHKSALSDFVQKKVKAGMPTDEIAKLTMKDIIEDDELRTFVSKSFAVVAADQTMADAKDAMDSVVRERKVSCKDIFVTKSGRSNDAVIGWITDNKIQEASVV